MRLASEVNIGFPYEDDHLCWIKMLHGEPTQVRGLGEKREAVRLAMEGTVVLYAVWPGQWRSDLFRLDDLEAAAQAVGAVRR